MSTSLTECTDGYSALETYYRAVAAYLASGGTPPDPVAAISPLAYDNLQTFTTNAISDAPDFSVGMAVEAVSEFYSIVRELDMATQGKVSLSIAANAEALEDADLHAQNGSFYSGVISGQPSSGTRS